MVLSVEPRVKQRYIQTFLSGVYHSYIEGKGDKPLKTNFIKQMVDPNIQNPL